MHSRGCAHLWRCAWMCSERWNESTGSLFEQGLTHRGNRFVFGGKRFLVHIESTPRPAPQKCCEDFGEAASHKALSLMPHPQTHKAIKSLSRELYLNINTYSVLVKRSCLQSCSAAFHVEHFPSFKPKERFKLPKRRCRVQRQENSGLKEKNVTENRGKCRENNDGIIAPGAIFVSLHLIVSENVI